MIQRKKTDFQGLVAQLVEKWPSAVVTRTEVETFTGGAITAKYLANLDSLGKGPKGRLRVGRKILYTTSSLCEWLIERTELVE
jgi:hypothetical protein